MSRWEYLVLDRKPVVERVDNPVIDLLAAQPMVRITGYEWQPQNPDFDAFAHDRLEQVLDGFGGMGYEVVGATENTLILKREARTEAQRR